VLQLVEQHLLARLGALALGDVDDRRDAAGPRRLSRTLRLFQADRELTLEEQPLQIAIRSGRPVSSFEGQLLRGDGERRDVMLTATPLFDEGGKARGAIAAIVDISERKKAEARQQVLLYELQHRVKNIIATISALASRTLRRDVQPEEFVQSFQGRLRGMASTHELLSRANWRGAPLGELVETALRSHASLDGGAIAVKGPDILMTPSAAATLGMVLYELATNAVKYGALSQSSGHLEVAWQLQGSSPVDRVALTWTESGGTTAPKDLAGGFGVNFVKRSFEYEMQGTATMEPVPGGLRWTLRFPISQNVQHL
jgi:two-component system CheB/CheR fusion protein